MTLLTQWAARHGVSPVALAELRQMMGVDTDPRAKDGEIDSENAAQTDVRLQASREGGRLWRNNSGALKDKSGRLVRFGLCNDSKELNTKVKSSDLIGIRPVTITPEMIGQRIGVFWAREMKEPGWKYRGTPREQAQLAFIELVLSLGGDAAFSTGELDPAATVRHTD